MSITDEAAWTDAGSFLRTARTHSGLTQRQLADRLGVTQTNVSQIERNGNNISVATVRRWMAAMGYNLMLGFRPAAKLDTAP